MSSPDHHSPNTDSLGYFLKMLFNGWLSLGPRNIWFYLVPLLVLAVVVSLAKSLVA